MKRLVQFFLILLGFACASTNKYTVTNVHDLALYPSNSYLYALPSTRLALKIKTVCHHTVPGPYCDYAEQYLGIEGAPRLSFTDWEILDVDLKGLISPDPDYYYTLEYTSTLDIQAQLEELREKKWILGPDEFQPVIQTYVYSEDNTEPIHFTDLTVKDLTASGTKTRSEARKNAKIPVDMPVIRQEESGKSVQAKAKDAADFIIKIRKRRFKLLAGQYDVYPEGEALEISVRELNKLEEEYLSLFTGRTYSDTLVKTFYYIPQAGNEIERYIICRFSEETGLLDASSTSGKPVVIDIKDLKSTTALKQIRIPSSGTSFENRILYRIPEQVSVRIIFGSSTLLEAEIPVYQYGAFVPLPIVSPR